MTQPALSTEAMQRARQAPRRSLGFRLWRWAHELGWRHLVAILALAFALFPVIWVISASINPIGSTLSSQKLIPSNPSFGNFRDLFSTTPFGRWMVNTILIAGGAAFINTALAAFAAYAFSRMRFRGRRTGLLSVLLVQMFPQVLAFVAIFVLMNSIGNVFPGIGDGTRLGLVLVYLGGAMGVNTWLMKGFFDTIPVDLDESAKVDGASHAQIYFKIIVPLVVPILAVVFFLSFIALFNDYVLARAVLGVGNEQNFTLSVGLYNFVSDRFNARWGIFAAGALVASIPIVILFQFLQRYIVSGLTQGAVKG
jgi:arabinogalactan oligomer/maltooligosaccharide transport system permease protein